jgi:cathepsin F
MKIAVVLLAVACVAFAMPTHGVANIYKPAPLADAEVQQLFEQFVKQHERTYYGVDKQSRYEIFRENVEKARYYNVITKDKVYGVTKFMDLTEQEFRSMYLMKQKTPEQLRKMFPANAEIVDSYKSKNALPTSFDWRPKGAVTPVKNQGACGSCWAFSATGNIEGQLFVKQKKLVSLSEQNLVDCDHECVEYEQQQSCDDGCNGGLMWAAFQYVQKNGGINTEESYPYEGVDGSCRYKNTTIGAKVSGFKMLPTKDEDLAAWLIDNGPVSVAVSLISFTFAKF